MSAEPFVTEHLDLWTSAVTSKSTSGRGSNGKIALTGIKKLRELILELAVRSKLVPQSDSDEPAPTLLEKIDAKKASLMVDGQIKKSKELPLVTDDESKFRLPSNWSWTRLGTIAQINPRNTAEDETETSFVPMPLITTSYTGEHSQERKRWLDIKKGYTHFADGDIGLAKITPCFENSKAAVFRGLHNGIGAGTTELHIARPYGATIDPLFILCFLKSPGFLTRGEARMTGTAGQKRLPKDFFAEDPIPLPPLAEQHRIVQKVDELMALCDRLEQQTHDQHAAHETLVDALLDTLTQSEDANELADNWARLAAHFDTLFTTEDSIEQLKQTVLELGVMGRLVSQEPDDEPAYRWLDKIEAGREQLVAEGRVKKKKKAADISDSMKPFEIPPGWTWKRLQTLTQVITKGSSPKWQGINYTNVSSDTLFITSENVDRFSLKFDKRKYVENRFNEIEPRSVLQTGDFLMNIVGASIGRTAIYDLRVPANINQAVCLIRILDKAVNRRFILNFFNSQLCVSYMLDKQVDSARANLSLNNIANFCVPLPPLREQARIVQKVDELMAVCDQLKAHLNEASETRRQMVAAVVEQAIH